MAWQGIEQQFAFQLFPANRLDKKSVPQLVFEIRIGQTVTAMKYLVVLCFFIGNIIDEYDLETNKTNLRYFSGLLASISAKIRSNADMTTFIPKGMKNYSNWEFMYKLQNTWHIFS